MKWVLCYGFVVAAMAIGFVGASPLPNDDEAVNDDDVSKNGRVSPPKGHPVEWVEYGLDSRQPFGNKFGTSGAQTYLMKNPNNTPFGPQPGYDMKLEEDNPALGHMKVLHSQMMQMPMEEVYLAAEMDAGVRARETNFKNFEDSRTITLTEKLQKDRR